MVKYAEEIKEADRIMFKYFNNNKVRKNINECINRADIDNPINAGIVDSIVNMYEKIDSGEVEELFWYWVICNTNMLFTDDISLHTIQDRALRKINNTLLMKCVYAINKDL